MGSSSPQPCATAGLSPRGAASAQAAPAGVSIGCPSFSLHLLHGCTWRCALCSAHGLKEDSLLLRGPLLGRRKLLLHSWSTSCPPSAMTLGAAGTLVPHLFPLSPSCSCTALFPSLQSTLPEAHPASRPVQLYLAVGTCGSSWSCSSTWRTDGHCSQSHPCCHPY